MITFLLFTGILVALYLFGFIKNGGEPYEWMGRKYTTALKGGSILTVMWAHTGAALGVGGIQFITGVGVALFLIFSGYGLELSYQKNQLKGYWLKRITSVFIPCIIVDIVACLIEGTTVRIFTNWYMTYILGCYIIFYCVKIAVHKFKLMKYELYLLIIIFALWLVIESTVLVDVLMPFLKARQMLSFITGMYIAQNREKAKNYIEKHTVVLSVFCILIGAGFMLITQFEEVKSIPYIISNVLSLGTVLPLAMMILVISNRFGRLIESKYLYFTGMCSYELYLIHFKILPILDNNMRSVLLFLFITYALAYTYKYLLKKGNMYGRFDSCNSHKK